MARLLTHAKTSNKSATSRIRQFAKHKPRVKIGLFREAKKDAI